MGDKERLASAIRRAAGELEAFGSDVFEHAELGFREHRTAALIADRFRALGLQPEEGLALTGVKARLRGSKPGPTIAVLGELDGLPVLDHPNADPETGAAHACGHNAQVTHVLGVARALVEADAGRELAGDVVFFAVPAEEYVDLTWRRELARDGKIEFLGGKAELLRLGAFDDVDMAILVHATGSTDDRQLSMRMTANGLVAKQVRFIGRASHAGAAPEKGINALNAATLALQAIHMQRETFRDDDHVRVHPILTHGGSTINVVPAEARLETFVRGGSYEAIADAAAKVDRALRAGALAVGATVEIETLPGYMPMFVDAELAQVFKRNARELVGERGWAEGGAITASTDAGDLSHVMPMLHPSHGGCSGTNHAADFLIADPTVAYIQPAIAVAWTILDLLGSDAAEARRVLSAFKPRLSKDQYLAHMRGLSQRQVFSS